MSRVKIIFTRRIFSLPWNCQMQLSRHWNWPLDRSCCRERGAAGFAALGIVLSVLAPGAAIGAGDSSAYRVRIVQPLKVGDRLHMQRDIEEAVSDTVTIGGGRGGREALEALELKFFGTLEVLEVDKPGVPSRWKVIAAVASVR